MFCIIEQVFIVLMSFNESLTSIVNTFGPIKCISLNN